MKLNREGVQLSAEERNKRNQNWATLEDEVSQFESATTDFNKTTNLLNGEITGLKAETAVQKNGLIATNKRVDNVVIEAGTAAYEKVVGASKLIWKEPVVAFSNLATAYPQPQNGWAAQTTSDGAVYRYDGSTWKKIQQVDAGPVNALDTRLTAQLTDIAVNVKSFGAKGDGVTDDTLAIQEALNGGNKKVFFPPGNYIVESLRVFSNTYIYGSGKNSVITTKPRTVSVEVVKSLFEIWGTSSNRIKDVTVENLSINGNRTNIVLADGISGIDMECINMKYADNCTIQNNDVYNTLSEGIDLDNCVGCFIVNNRVDDAAGYGIHISEGSQRNLIEGNQVTNSGFIRNRGGVDQYNGNVGLGLLSADNNLFIGNISKNNKKNFNIKGTGAIFNSNQSSGGELADDVSGVSRGMEYPRERILVTRNLAETGVQTVALSTNRKPTSLTVMAVVQTTKMKCDGFWSSVGGSRSIYLDGTTGNFQNAVSPIILSSDNGVNRTNGTILNVRKGAFDIDWTLTGIGANSTTSATIIFLVDFQGGTE